MQYYFLTCTDFMQFLQFFSIVHMSSSKMTFCIYKWTFLRHTVDDFSIVIYLSASEACYFFRVLAFYKFWATVSSRQAVFIYCVWISIEWLLIDRFSRFCTAHGKQSLYFTIGEPFPQNCPFPWGIWTLSNTWFIGPIRVHNPDGISIVSADDCKHLKPITVQCIWHAQ